MFSNLMNEVEALRNAWGYNILEAIMWIREHEEVFPSEVRMELNEFMRQGQQMFGA
jgi:hypothetical protein